MSFAGHVFDMIARMKANARDKRRPFDREVDAQAPAIRPEYLRKACEEELAYWREKTLADLSRQRRLTVAVLVGMVVIAVVMMVLLG